MDTFFIAAVHSNGIEQLPAAIMISKPQQRKTKMALKFTVLLSFFTILRFTSAMRHLFTLAWLRSGGFTNAITALCVHFDDAG